MSTPSVLTFSLTGQKAIQGYKISVKVNASKGVLTAVDVFLSPKGSVFNQLLYTEVFNLQDNITQFERVSDRVRQDINSFSDLTLFVKAGVQLDTGLQIESGIHTFPGL
jgi:hypothetical protein